MGDSTTFLTFTSTSTLTSLKPTAIASTITSSPTPDIVKITSSAVLSSGLSTSISSHDTTGFSMSTAPAIVPQSGLNQLITNISSGTSSQKLALAIGVPVGILVFFSSIILVWYYFKKRSFNKRRSQLEDFHNNEKYSTTFKNMELGDTLSKVSNTSDSMDIVHPPPEFDDTDYNLFIQPAVRIPINARRVSTPKTAIRSLFNRFSRTVESEAPSPASLSTGSPSYPGKHSTPPAFLKSFILSKSKKVETPQIQEMITSQSFVSDSDSKTSTKVLSETSSNYSISPQFVEIRPPKENKMVSLDPAPKSSIKKQRNKNPLPFFPIVSLKHEAIEEGKLSEKKTNQQEIYVVVKSYSKRMEDELDLNRGELVTVGIKHADGWCSVTKLKDGTIGVVPQLYLKRRSTHT